MTKSREQHRYTFIAIAMSAHKLSHRPDFGAIGHLWFLQVPQALAHSPTSN